MGYFADDYGLTMIALEEEGKEATAQTIQGVIDRAKKENIKVIFYQAEMDSKQARTIAQELGGKAELIAPLAPDYVDNLRKTAQTFAEVVK
jgi:zinc transport system substrate-binding protein